MEKKKKKQGGLSRDTLESQLKVFLLVLLDLINEHDQLEHSPNFTKKMYPTNICPNLTWPEFTAPALTSPDQTCLKLN